MDKQEKKRKAAAVVAVEDGDGVKWARPADLAERAGWTFARRALTMMDPERIREACGDRLLREPAGYVAEWWIVSWLPTPSRVYVREVARVYEWRDAVSCFKALHERERRNAERGIDGPAFWIEARVRFRGRDVGVLPEGTDDQLAELERRRDAVLREREAEAEKVGGAV